MLLQVDTLVVDTLTVDTLEVQKTSAAIKSKVDYSSNDSIRFDVKNQEVFLFGNAEINYDKINLKAAYIKIEFEKSIAFAEGVKDSTGKIVGSPVFTENSQSYKSRTMKYNYETKKGLITKVFTQDGDGYLHGKIIKKMENNEINVKYGSYTTCSNEEHPHYEFRFNKSKVIPGKKIITGPAHLVIEGVSTPLFIPFGLFPNKTGQRSGVLIPTYGESANRGFYFEDGGYYWAISNYLDFKLTGDIYTRGSWAVKPYMNYIKRYKFRGSFNMTYAVNLVGDKGSSGYQKSNDFAVRWVHSQDPKARPNSKFSANVNIVSNQYNKYNPTSTEVFLSNTFQSSVAYQTNWAGKYFLTVNGSHSQNTGTKKVNITLPELSFSVNRFYPLRKKAKAGQLKWYENISMNYTMNAKNTINI
ncbi:MAG: LPS-assembly protein LptD, partial [Bacteroidales bacterium]|nr:LPS-assembly protein LptD [Bacteroidales bacterium]